MRFIKIAILLIGISCLSHAFAQHKTMKGLPVRLSDTAAFVADLKNMPGLKKDIDQAKSEKFLFDYDYFFRVNRKGNIEPKVYFNTSTDKFLGVADYVKKKFNHYKWLVTMPRKINLYNESAALDLLIKLNPSEDTVNVSITQTIPNFKFRNLREKRLYKVSIAYKDLN